MSFVFSVIPFVTLTVEVVTFSKISKVESSLVQFVLLGSQGLVWRQLGFIRLPLFVVGICYLAIVWKMLHKFTHKI